MIPFTPDERRAEFAPSQNPGGPVDPDVLAVLGQPAQEPAVAQPTMNQQVDPDVLDIVNRDQIPLMSSLMSASRVNPDQAAEASRLGARIGVGQDVALRNLDEVRQRAFMADMQARDIARTNPVLASFLMDRNFSQQASDDVGVLDGLKNVFMDVGRVAAGMPAVYVPGELARGYMRGERIAERGVIGLKATVGEAEQSDYERARQLQEEMRALGEPGFLSSAAEMVAQNVAGMREVAATTLIGGAAGTVIPGLGTAAGMGIGFATGTAATTARMEAGNLYLDLIEQGVSEDAAVPAALAGGLINGAIEAVGAKIATAPFKDLLSKVVRERLAEAVTKPTIRAALTQAGKSYVLQVGTEAAEEGTQELTNIVSEEMAKWSDGIKSETTLGQAVDRIIDATAQGAMGAAIIGGIGPGANLAIDLRRAKSATTAGERIQQLVDRSKQLKLRTRNPDAAENIGNQYGVQSGIEQFYVDAKVMRGVMEQAGLKPSDINAVIPGLADRIATEAERGGDVTITPGQLIARIAGTPFGDAITPHLRVAANALSVVDAQAVEASRAEIVAQAEKLMEEKQTVDAAFVQSAQAVEDSIFNAVKAVGYSDVQARTYAKIHQAMVVVDAAAMGITPEEYNRRYLPTIVGAGMPVQAMEQAARPEFPSVAKAWKAYTEGDEVQTPQDLADTMASLVEDGRAPESVAEAVKAFREAEAYELETKGRGGELEAAGDALETAVQNAATQMRARLGGAPQVMEQAARIDADYLAAVERGDMATAQRMVDEAARASTRQGPIVDGVELTDAVRQEPRFPTSIEWITAKKVASLLGDTGRLTIYDQASTGSLYGYITFSDGNVHSVRIADHPKPRPSAKTIVDRARKKAVQPKAQDAVTRDEAGNIVPLSRRFDITSPMVFEQAAIPFAQAPVSPGFYSVLAKAVDAVDAKSMAASGWKERIKGLVNKGEVKQDEVDWSGLTDWLDMQEGKVTKEAVAEFLKNNGVRVERVFLSDRAVDTAPYTVEESVDTEGNEIWIVYDPDVSREMGVFDNQIDAEREADRLTDAATIAKGRPSGETKFGKYTLPGGTNYREVMITLPAVDRRELPAGYKIVKNQGIWKLLTPDNYFTTIGGSDFERVKQQAIEALVPRVEYRSPHWNQPNVLVHFRLNDRVDADGKRVLFVEEIQSDWGQAGREKGFKGRMTVAQIQEAAAPDRRRFYSGMGDMSQEEWSALSERVRQWDEQENAARSAVPLAPFVETTDGWLNLALKNILLEATQGNYDRVAFVNGKQSADRYTLEKTVSLIEVVPRISAVTGERTRSVTMHLKEGGRPSFGIDANGIIDNVDEKTYTNLKGKPLADVVGKEMAEKIMAVGKGDRASFEGDDLKVGGRGMIEFYDKIVPAAVNKMLKKYGGGKLETANIRLATMATRDELTQSVYGRNETYETLPENAKKSIDEVMRRGGSSQPAFSVTPEMVKKLESGLPLFQAMPAGGPARGGFDPRRLTTIINKGADVTTLFHELIHYKVEVYLRIASAPDAPARIKADLDELFKFMGIAGASFEERLATYNGLTFEQRRPLEEQITYNFEDYLLEGKAPSVEMRGVFDRIAAWMRRVYKSLRDDLNAIYKREFGTDLPILTPEIRAVFDRMLASEEQIKRAEAVNNMKGLFQTQEQSGMDDATWAAYQAMQKEATDEAIAALTADTMKQVEWMSNARSKKLKELQKAHDTQRKEIRDQVMAEVRQEPIYRAMEYLKRGTLIGPDGSEATVEGVHKINTALAREFVPGLDMAKMGRGKYGYLAEDGLHPDIVAEMFGFPAGSALLQALADAKPMREVVDARTDEIMVRDYSEMGDPKAQEAAVNRAIHNEARARLVAVEARWLSKATQPVRVIQEAARQAAVDAVGNTVIRNLRPDQYAAAEARASRDAIEAARGADTKRLRDRYGAEATREQIMLQAKRQQLYQNALATEAQKADDAIQKGLKYLRRVLRDSNRKRMGADAADQISAILDNFSLVPMTRAQRENVRALRDWLATNAENGLMLDVDPALADAANRKNYVEMTVTEFNDLLDSVKQIEYNGKHEAEIRLGKEKAIFAEKRDEITANMEQVAEKRGRKVRKELGDEDRKWMNTIASWDASQQTIGSITYLLDGGQRDGPLSRYLVATANDAGNQEAEDTARITEIVNNILDPIAKKGGFSAKKITFPQIGEALSLRNRMVIALNYGNQSNIDRLLAGEGWSEDIVQQIIATLTEEELNAVQALWDVMSSFKDRVAEKSRRLTGKEPRWIDPKPFTVRSSDGKIVQMRGGYYPAKYNPLRSIGARVAEVAEDADRMRREAFTASTTSRSFEKNRSDRPPQGQVLTREFTGLYAGLKEVIHDLAWHDWSIAANRLLRDKDFQRIIKERYGNQTYTAIKDWVDTVVVGDRTKHDPFEMFAVYARRNVSAAAMGLRLMTAAIQPTGVFPAMSRNGIRSMVRAAAEFGYAPLQSTRNAVERSKFMANRNRTRFRDLNEIRNVVQEESALSRVQKKYLSSAYVLVSFVQGVVDTITWMSSYSNSIAAGKSEQDAIFIADQTVIDTQGSGRLQDLSRAMRGGEKQSAYAKLFTSFYQYSNTMYALATTQVRTAPNYGKMTKDLLLILTVGALVEELIRHALKPSADEEPEDMMKKLVGNQIDFVIGLPFGLREFRGVGAWMMDTKGGGLEYRGPSGLRMVSDVNRALVQIKQGEFDRALRKSIITLMGTTFGIPSAQINDTIDGIEALYEGETENVLAPVTGVRR